MKSFHCLKTTLRSVYFFDRSAFHFQLKFAPALKARLHNRQLSHGNFSKGRLDTTHFENLPGFIVGAISKHLPASPKFRGSLLMHGVQARSVFPGISFHANKSSRMFEHSSPSIPSNPKETLLSR